MVELVKPEIMNVEALTLKFPSENHLTLVYISSNESQVHSKKKNYK